MSTFVINPHGRLQEWIAEEKGYFEKAGLHDYQLQAHDLLTKDTPKKDTSTGATDDNRQGAYKTYEDGRSASMSCACHWTVNMAAAANHGRIWGECYSVSPCAILVAENSGIRTPADLAGVDIHVGYLSGSHYTTIQALEPYMSSDSLSLKFGGNPAERVDQMLDGVIQAATVFGPQLYLLEQLGFRKIIDSTFMIAAMVPDDVDTASVRNYYQAMRWAQRDLDMSHQPYVKHYLKELPERHAKLIDVGRFGPGERFVFEPYSEEVYHDTQSWILERGIFSEESNPDQLAGYQQSVIRQ